MKLEHLVMGDGMEMMVFDDGIFIYSKTGHRHLLLTKDQVGGLCEQFCRIHECYYQEKNSEQAPTT